MVVGKEEKAEESLELFLKIGLDERTANNTIANNKVTTNLIAVIHEVLYFNLSLSLFFVFISPFYLVFFVGFISIFDDFDDLFVLAS